MTDSSGPTIDAAPTLRAARSDDLAAVERLLTANGLPVAGVAEILNASPGDFVIAEDPGAPGEILAVAGLQICCDSAVLRSVAVHPSWRKQGFGHTLVQRVVADAEARGVHALYLLTMTAEHYFPRFGFERIERNQVPSEVADTVEFKSACPASAVVMRKGLRD
jgi:amino-acid N-acetyltransferase